jgi:hypothetical protein
MDILLKVNYIIPYILSETLPSMNKRVVNIIRLNILGHKLKLLFVGVLDTNRYSHAEFDLMRKSLDHEVYFLCVCVYRQVL